RNDDGDAAGRVGLDGHARIGHDAGVFEAGDQIDVALHVLGQLTHDHRDGRAGGQLRQSHQVAVVAPEAVADAQIDEPGNRVTERGRGRVIEHLHQAALDVVAHDVLPAARFGVDF